MNYYIFKEFLMRLGFISASDINQEASSLLTTVDMCRLNPLSEIWRILGGE